MRIGELAKRTGLSRDAIRFYERQGLIKPTGREGENSYKSYPEDAVMTVDVIRDAQAAGMSIADLSILLSQFNAATADGFDGDGFLADKIEQTQARLDATQRFLDMLIQSRTALARAPLPD